MARYIDADKLAEKIKRCSAFKKHNGFWADAFLLQNVVLDLIDNAPTADVVEVKHGKWVDRYKNKYANHLYVCSVCSGKALYDFYVNDLDQMESRQELTGICPRCFAIMDGGNAE